MPSSDTDGFCYGSLWNSTLSWETPDPDLSLCLEKTALVWGPSLLLWLLTPIELFTILHSKCRDIPWRFINLAKLLVNLVLIAVSAISLVWSTVLKFSGDKVYLVDIWTPAIQTVTFTLALVLLLWSRVRGIHTSGGLFLFWLVLAVAGVAQMRTELIGDLGKTEEPRFKFVLYMIYFPAVILMFILSMFADPPPRVTDYPKYQKICPEVHASFLSRLLFRWFDPLLWKGLRRPLIISDLWSLQHKDTSAQVVPRFEKNLRNSFEKTERIAGNHGKASGSVPVTRNRSTQQVSIIGTIFKTFWLPIFTGAILRATGDALSFANPQILNAMIHFVAGKEYMWRGFLYAIGMFVAAQLQTIINHNNFMSMSVVGLNVRSALISAIYKKALRISNSARKTATVGEVVNLMAVDAQRCSDFFLFGHYAWTCPIIIIVALYFLWQILGIAILAGVVVMIVIIPINTVIANQVKKLQAKQMKYKDNRVKLMNEVLSGIKVLKLYAWEPSFKDQINRIREKEVSVLKTAALWNASTSFIWLNSSFLVSCSTLAMFVLIDERNVLTPEIAFVSTALFNVMRVPISFLPFLIQMSIQTIVSVKRINKFLNAEELDLKSVSHDESREEPLTMEGASLSWGTEQGDTAILKEITLHVRTGSLVAVVGAVGSGKSSLISAFLGEMDKISGYINIKGKIAYVPQQAWIQNATVRDNILFGKNFDSKRYYSTVEACALNPDFEILPSKDSTEIGEKGINLSGGQKQRVSLARAVYNNADTYLLDDPLSAVDSHVGKHIFDNVIGPKGVLNKKTRILVTHGVTFLQHVDMIVVMKGGQITETGTFSELLAKKGEFSNFLVQHITNTEETDLDTEIEELIEEHTELKQQLKRQLSKNGSIRSTSSNPRKGSQVSADNEPPMAEHVDKLIQAEKTETGEVKWGVYIDYLRALGPPLALFVIIFTMVSQALGICTNIWLSDWTSDPTVATNGVQDSSQRDYYLSIYAVFGFAQMGVVVVSAFLLAFATIRASRHLHHSMLSNILRSPMSFFDTTPSGRLVNRFSKDIDIVDNVLPFTVSNAVSSFATVIGTVVVITWSTPLFAVLIIPLGILYYFVQKFYITTSRQLKRMELVSRSPIYSHFGETISGAPSIRAYGVEDRFIKTSDDRVDMDQVCFFPSLVSDRWLGVRLETIGNLLIFFAALFAVLGRDSIDAGIVGLSISYSLQITGMLNFAVRMASEVETNIVSIERIKEYSEVPQEAAWEVQPRPGSGWPQKGTVRFQDYQVRYREGLELVLKGISFTVNGGEKVGIVGRTGAGKSSLTLCLFRIIEAAAGKIYIDDTDIANIGLGDLRSKITIIPQDPVLFSGTLRMNLDPFEAYSDTDVWRALQLAHLSEFSRGLSAGLSHNVTEGGDNLSVGQRQLICLARALLRKTQLLVLDEATAAVDLETDDLIQKTIRTEFRHCTVLTIAHRLNTIMDSDRVIVLDKGLIKEYDSPSNLLKVDTSIFYGMAKDAGLV